MNKDKHFHILVVDDELNMREIIKDIFESEGYACTVAGTGKEALEFLKKEHFDFLLLDVRLLDMSGIDVFRKMQEGKIDVPVIFMSAYTTDELKEWTFQEGAVAFFDKSVRMNELLDALREKKNISIFLIGDQNEFRDVEQELIRKNYQFACTSSHEDALKILRQIHTDIIFLDISVTGEKSLEFYHALRTIAPNSFVIVLCENTKEFITLADEIVLHSAYAYLIKPIDGSTILEFIHKLIPKIRSHFSKKSN
jgi:DNA-binding NtrC family response regulator